MPRNISTVYDESEFYREYIRDLRAAKALVLIQSPFLAPPRVEMLSGEFRNCTKRGVRLCIFAQAPRDWDSPKRETNAQVKKVESAIQMLRACGAHLTLRPLIHAKLSTIDNRVFWDGSLNICSHYNTKERMTRWESSEKVKEAVLKHELNLCKECICQPACLTQQSGVTDARLGQYIASQRERLGLSQAALSKLVGFDRKDLANLELGQHNASLSRLTQVLGGVESELLSVPWYLRAAVEEFVKCRMTCKPESGK
jgi:hypothetical protein